MGCYIAVRNLSASVPELGLAKYIQMSYEAFGVDTDDLDEVCVSVIKEKFESMDFPSLASKSERTEDDISKTIGENLFKHIKVDQDYLNIVLNSKEEDFNYIMGVVSEFFEEAVYEEGREKYALLALFFDSVEDFAFRMMKPEDSLSFSQAIAELEGDYSDMLELEKHLKATPLCYTIEYENNCEPSSVFFTSRVYDADKEDFVFKQWNEPHPLRSGEG